MKEREAKNLCESNDLKDIIIEPAVENNGWVLKFITYNGTEDTLISKRNENEPRIFKTVDACVNCCKKIGAKNVTLIIKK